MSKHKAQFVENKKIIETKTQNSFIYVTPIFVKLMEMVKILRQKIKIVKYTSQSKSYL